MESGLRFLLIAIALRGSFANSWPYYPDSFTCPTYMENEFILVNKVRTLLCETDFQFCNSLYWSSIHCKAHLLENLYYQYNKLVKISRDKDEKINNLLYYEKKSKELSEYIKTAKISQLAAAIPNAKFLTPNKDLETCKLELNQKIEIISRLEGQLNSTKDQKEELRKQLESKNEVAQVCPEPSNNNKQIDPPKYLMEVSKTSTCDHFTNQTGIRPFEFTWMDQDRTFCDRQLKGPGWMVIQRRIDGQTDFYRKWLEYRQGFGDLNAEYFIGLENLHRFTRKFAPCELLIQLEDFEGETRYARYDNFIVGDESSSYELKSLGKYSGDAGDALSYNLHSKFSTSDRDSPDECAQLRVGAWWYSESCGFSNLNGLHQASANLDFDNDGTGIFWHDEGWHEFDYSLKSVKMMIRSRAN